MEHVESAYINAKIKHVLSEIEDAQDIALKRYITV